MMKLDSPHALQRLMKADFPPSEEQFAAITAPLAPTVVIAGAGSGKTTLMAARVVYLVATGSVDPDQVLGLTFTNKAAGELRSRIREVLGNSGYLQSGEGSAPIEPTVATYNAYAGNLLAEHGLRVGYEPSTRVIADASRYQLAARVVSRHAGRVEALTDYPPLLLRYILEFDAQVSEHLTDLDAVRQHTERELELTREALAAGQAKQELSKLESACVRRLELLPLVAAYRELKARMGVIEFSDQIARCVALIDAHPDVAAAERARFPVVLLDEYQDTSVAQARLLSGIFADQHAVMAVGDPNQAIYGWRGASVSNILNFHQDFPGAQPDSTRLALTINRRSDARILRVANHLARDLYAQADVAELAVGPQAGQGRVSMQVHESDLDELQALPAQVRQAQELTGQWSKIAVLTRDNASAATVYNTLNAAGLPVEIVGLKGLLELPEVREVVATLRLLHNLSDNAAMLSLLTSPRWNIGTRDLALLGRRASDLVRAPRSAVPGLDDELDRIASGVDPVEVPSLCDALEHPVDPGNPQEWGYSPEGLERFALLAGELRYLRRLAGEPLLETVRRIIDLTGVDLELASSLSPAAAARRDNLDAFVKSVAEFQAVDGEVTLPALLAWLEAEDEYGNGLDVATPSTSDSVKLLTVHRSKGLEWDVVFLLGVNRDRFPAKNARSTWVTVPHELPHALRGDARDLPGLAEVSAAGLKAFGAANKTHHLHEELRLAYVALTRARKHLHLSSFFWKAGRKTPAGPSAYLGSIRDLCLSDWGGEGLEQWSDAPAEASNPLTASSPVAWPAQWITPELRRREAGARLVRQAQELRRQQGSDDAPLRAPRPEEQPELTAEERALLSGIDHRLRPLVADLADRARSHVTVPLPASLSATSLARVLHEPDTLAADLARPMPRLPSPGARLGTRFHAFVEDHFGGVAQGTLLDPDDLPGRAASDVVDETDLEQLQRKFLASPFAGRPGAIVEPAFSLVLAGQVIKGRIDAVFPEPDGGWLIVDWKTNRAHTADPLQLAVYRLAWAELHDVPLDAVAAAFYYVRDGETVRFDDLPDREALEALFASASPTPHALAQPEAETGPRA